jgi:hypothetical protein
LAWVVLITIYGVFVTLSRRDAVHGATLAVAMLAIFLKQHGHHDSVAFTAGGAAQAAASAAVLALVPPEPQAPPEGTEAEQQVHEALSTEP